MLGQEIDKGVYCYDFSKDIKEEYKPYFIYYFQRPKIDKLSEGLLKESSRLNVAIKVAVGGLSEEERKRFWVAYSTDIKE